MLRRATRDTSRTLFYIKSLSFPTDLQRMRNLLHCVHNFWMQIACKTDRFAATPPEHVIHSAPRFLLFVESLVKTNRFASDGPSATCFSKFPIAITYKNRTICSLGQLSATFSQMPFYGIACKNRTIYSAKKILIRASNRLDFSRLRRFLGWPVSPEA